MALALTKPKSISPETYLAQEEIATGKSEYFRGAIYMMANKYFHKGEVGRWVLTEFKAITDLIRIEAIDMALSLALVYERVVWEDSDNA